MAPGFQKPGHVDSRSSHGERIMFRDGGQYGAYIDGASIKGTWARLINNWGKGGRRK